jgi:hypothetical protein
LVKDFVFILEAKGTENEYLDMTEFLFKIPPRISV